MGSVNQLRTSPGQRALAIGLALAVPRLLRLASSNPPEYDRGGRW